MEFLTHSTNLTPDALLFAIIAAFIAGMIRGFAGFGLSAVVMASIATIIPPIDLIPVCYLLESVASIVMFRGGLRDADMRIVWILVIGSAIGLPIGLFATTQIDAQLSKIVALSLLATLAIVQLANFQPRFLARPWAVYAAGITAGIATGLASIGGMVIALYVLTTRIEAKIMRASLVMFLFVGMFTSAGYYWLYDIMDAQAITRGIALVPFLLLGLTIGTQLFRPDLTPYYRLFCLWLLVGLSILGLGRLLF